jgi:hypothetical protein
MSLVTLVSRSLEMGDFGEWAQGGMPGESFLRVGEVRVFMMATLWGAAEGLQSFDLYVIDSAGRSKNRSLRQVLQKG